MSLPRVVLGILPERATYQAPATNGFIMFDNRLVHVETITAELSVTQPREIALYGRMFTQLSEQAVYGESTRRLIMAELEERR
ncbi:Scr1 family TA system antitoxin-like transcriptional regulator [Nocardia otitidiscaviarum]|uniref:Scr1 family TA system antitoxin-like transcriptional regulator n=1 Tax=Nocardia otitidiscaviarum TaxID=1823 RepID=UPI0011C02611|nr:Scr1 family TA system antitoxin-like transcriptional regulator [Nocardia otitidiscaviarum]